MLKIGKGSVTVRITGRNTCGFEETWRSDPAWLARFGLVQATLPVLRDLAVLGEPF